MSKRVKNQQILNEQHAKVNKTTWMITGGIFLAALSLGSFVYYKQHKPVVISQPALSKEDIPTSIGDSLADNAKATLVERQRREITDLRSQVSKQNQMFDTYQKSTEQQLKVLSEQLTSTQKDLRTKLVEQSKVEENTNNSQNNLSQQVDQRNLQQPDLNMTAMGASLDYFSNTVTRDYQVDTYKNENDLMKYYVMPGSFVSGVTLTGGIIDSGVNASQNGTPINIQLTTDATMPNNYKFPLKGCFVVVNSYGDVSSERASILMDKIACIGEDGTKYEAKVNGIGNGQSGAQGLRGKLVLRNNKILTDAFIAGAIAGIGKAGSVSQTSQSQNDLTGAITTNVPPKNIIPYGLMEGFSQGAQKSSDYLMKLVNMYHPVIEIHGGSHLDLWFEEGFYLKPVTPKNKKSSHDAEGNSKQNIAKQVQAIKQGSLSQPVTQEQMHSQAQAVLQQIKQNTAKYSNMNQRYIGG